MAEKDITEKALEAYNDVFADIVNTLIFGGEPVVSEDSLTESETRSQYKADGNIHEQERDVAKYWENGLLRLALFGIENQTRPDGDMALRIAGYDGAAYRAQLLADETRGKDGKPQHKKKPRYPVFSFVLYFGTKHRWTKKRTLRESLDVPIPEKLKPYFHDYGVNVFEIAWLSEEQVNLFQSDFRIVADYFVQTRKNRDYTPPKDTIRHVHELLQLMSVMLGDHRFEEAYNEQMEREETTMCEVLDKIEARGQLKGEVKILADLVCDKVLTLEQAAARISTSVEEFVLSCKKYNYTL